MKKKPPVETSGYMESLKSNLRISLPVMQFRGKKVLVYYETQQFGSKGLQLFRQDNMRKQQATAYSGKLTQGAKKRLTKAISLLVQGTRKRWIRNPISNKQQLHQLTFVTLTVSDTSVSLTGKQAHKILLKPFLEWLTKTKKVNTYLWKAELQKNGQLHYHLTLPDWIHWREIRDKWNEVQNKAGIIERYREHQKAWHKNGFRVRKELLPHWPEYEQRKAYQKGVETNWNDPNSTDVHKVYKIKDVEAYLIKEIAKGIQNAQGLGGKVWDCSMNLKQGKYHNAYMKQTHLLFMEQAVNECLASKFIGEQFVIYNFEEPPQEYLLTDEEFSKYRTWLTVLQNSIVYNDQEFAF